MVIQSGDTDCSSKIDRIINFDWSNGKTDRVAKQNAIVSSFVLQYKSNQIKKFYAVKEPCI